jgi:site-specific recombinase XerD
MSQFGWNISRSQIDETIETIQKKNPLMKRWRCHDLRHSFAFNFLKRGGDMYALKAILEHKSIQLTIDLYGHLWLNTLREFRLMMTKSGPTMEL